MGSTSNRATHCSILPHVLDWRDYYLYGNATKNGTHRRHSKSYARSSCGGWLYYILVATEACWHTIDFDFFRAGYWWNHNLRIYYRLAIWLTIPRCWCAVPQLLVVIKEDWLMNSSFWMESIASRCHCSRAFQLSTLISISSYIA